MHNRVLVKFEIQNYIIYNLMINDFLNGGIELINDIKPRLMQLQSFQIKINLFSVIEIKRVRIKSY